MWFSRFWRDLVINNRNSRTRCEICSKLTIKTPERRWKYCNIVENQYLNKHKQYRDIFSQSHPPLLLFLSTVHIFYLSLKTLGKTLYIYFQTKLKGKRKWNSQIYLSNIWISTCADNFFIRIHLWMWQWL